MQKENKKRLPQAYSLQLESEPSIDRSEKLKEECMNFFEKKDRELMKTLYQKSVSGKNLSDAESEISDYLTRCGVLAETPGIQDQAKAEYIRKKREENYHNITTLLEHYRSLQTTYSVVTEGFNMRLSQDDHSVLKDCEDGGNLFDRLYGKLDLMSETDERKFRDWYVPQIEIGRKIEVITAEVQHGLKILQARNEDWYTIIYFTYICEKKRPVKELIIELGYSNHSSYYKRLTLAKHELAKIIFGYASNKTELISLLYYFRQKEEDDYFPLYNLF